MTIKRNIPKQFQTSDGADIRIGLALGSGSARGWSHIGVIQELIKMGIEPGIVTGTSIGAFVGAVYANNQIDLLEDWTRSLTWKEMINYIELSVIGGGFIKTDKLFKFVRNFMDRETIESLPRHFATVATELYTGREIWLQKGKLLDAIHASTALPGIIAPVKLNGQWLVDGGLSNPVPVSLCRALGAKVVIAVNLNGDIVGKHTRKQTLSIENTQKQRGNDESSLLNRASALFNNNLHKQKDILLSQLLGDNLDSPGMFEVIASSVNIMQDRITRSRMAGDPPDVTLSPSLSQLGLMEFDKADIAIEEGRACVRQMRPALERLMKNL